LAAIPHIGLLGRNPLLALFGHDPRLTFSFDLPSALSAPTRPGLVSRDACSTSSRERRAGFGDASDGMVALLGKIRRL
jgi:hypothetical protein